MIGYPIFSKRNWKMVCWPGRIGMNATKIKRMNPYCSSTGRICHASGVRRLVRKELWAGRSAARFYDALEWIYAWKPQTCLTTNRSSKEETP